jgi:hypothetical protein
MGIWGLVKILRTSDKWEFWICQELKKLYCALLIFFKHFTREIFILNELFLIVSCFLTWFSVLLLLAYGHWRDSVTDGSCICWIYWSKRACGSELIIAEFQWCFPFLLLLCYWLCQSIFVSMLKYLFLWYGCNESVMI